MLLVAMAYYLWAVGSDLPGLRLAVGFAGVQSFPGSSVRRGTGSRCCPWLVCVGVKVATVQDFNSCN